MGASLIFSDLYGIVGLIYANCVNMGIRITTSLYYAFNLEDDNRVALETFLKDLVSIDIKFIISIVKQRFKRGSDKDKESKNE